MGNGQQPTGLTKRLEFSSENEFGYCFAEAVDVTRAGGGLQKIASAGLHPEIAAFLKTLRPHPNYQFVLMTPMGAFEYWGMNANGDIFPACSLKHDRDCDDPVPVAVELEARYLKPHGKVLPPGNAANFGFKTFLESHRYRHHVNKDPSRSYGGIVLAVYNPAMQRVELIVRHDREAAKRVGAEDIVADFDKGKPRQISMGCKVPFDVCTVCGNIARTPRDYCVHLKTGMGSVRDDGVAVGAVNFFPRFFDLSDVIIPAAKESGTLMKVAQHLAAVKAAAANKKAAHDNKVADIKKRVLNNAAPAKADPTRQAVEAVSKSDPDLSPKVLRMGGSLQELLTTLMGMGVVLRPHEFQYSALHHAGRPELAAAMHSAGSVFSPARRLSLVAPPQPRDFSSSLARLLAPLLGVRSGLYPHLPRRAVRIIVIKGRDAAEAPAPAEKTKVANDQILEKIAQAYDSYRNGFANLPDLLSRTVEADLDFYQDHFLSDLITDSMAKVASSPFTSKWSSPLPTMYFYNAHRDGFSNPPPGWSEGLNPTSPARALLHPVL